MKHVVLAGDSVFDNDTYVLGEPGVIEQLRKSIPEGWSAFKLAVDGHRIADIERQLGSLPTNCTDLFISVGGNDARRYTHLLERIRSAADLPKLLDGPLQAFRSEYGCMLDLAKAHSVRVHICSIYTAIPFENATWRQYAPMAIGAFNSAIIEQAELRDLSIVRLDQVCLEPDDFSQVSPIEPSSQGGQKIVEAIVSHLS
ncbi:MAG: SGNH/GDSL hydrolase family protein [Pseudomonadota bacterium]